MSVVLAKKKNLKKFGDTEILETETCALGKICEQESDEGKVQRAVNQIIYPSVMAKATFYRPQSLQCRKSKRVTMNFIVLSRNYMRVFQAEIREVTAIRKLTGRYFFPRMICSC